MSDANGQRHAARKILVACLGNPDRGDDGVGALVAQALKGRLPADVPLMTRSGDMLSLIDDWRGVDGVVCIDAAEVMGTPGRIRRIDLGRETLPADMAVTSGHAVGLAEAVQLARTLGLAPAEIIVYAVEGGCFDGGAAMSAAVAQAVDEVARRVIEEVRGLQGREAVTDGSARPNAGIAM